MLPYYWILHVTGSQVEQTGPETAGSGHFRWSCVSTLPPRNFSDFFRRFPASSCQNTASIFQRFPVFSWGIRWLYYRIPRDPVAGIIDTVKWWTNSRFNVSFIKIKKIPAETNCSNLILNLDTLIKQRTGLRISNNIWSSLMTVKNRSLTRPYDFSTEELSWNNLNESISIGLEYL